jgi:(S)-ureidoglycine-glyoxylate aminotransferase
VRVKPALLALVQGDTSTTMLQPLEEIGEICRRHGVLFYSDATASLGGNAFEADAWGLDAATAGLQKCLGGPSGSSPITLSRARWRSSGRARRSRRASASRATSRRPTSSARTTSTWARSSTTGARAA